MLTDSGGRQEETTYLGIPCFALRENTDRPITIEEGPNRLVRAETLAASIGQAFAGGVAPHPAPALWNGRTAERCVEGLGGRQALLQNVTLD